MNKKKYFILFAFMLLFCTLTNAQKRSISENKRVRYLKKIEKKNDRYVSKEQKRNCKLLEKLNITEKKLNALSQLTSLYNSHSVDFAKLRERLNKNKDTLLTTDSVLLLSNIPENLDYKVKGYLKNQITMYYYLTDSSKTPSARLQERARRTKQNILETEQKLASLQTIEKKTKNHKDELKKIYADNPNAQKQLKRIDKNCYYFTQGMDGYKSIYTSPASGIENNLSKALSFNTDYTKFAGNLSASQGIIPVSGKPDLAGLQTKIQVQALMPQNATGINSDQKAQLVANINSSFTKFQQLRNKRPDLGALKDRPTFRVNPYKGLPLKQRIQFGKELQVHPANKYYPVIADAGATIGFKLTRRITPLIGASYKLGFGNDINNIRLSSEGIIARGGFDFKIAYGFSMECLYEETFKFIPKLINEAPAKMQEPAFIVGIMNKCKISKKTSSTLFFGYDFFYNQHTPYTTPWIVRVGWQ